VLRVRQGLMSGAMIRGEMVRFARTIAWNGTAPEVAKLSYLACAASELIRAATQSLFGMGVDSRLRREYLLSGRTPAGISPEPIAFPRTPLDPPILFGAGHLVHCWAPGNS
jgi:hypothetical protein